MQVSVRRLDKTTIFDVSGDVDLASSPAVRKALLHEVSDECIPRVLLNLSQVRYMDSSGVASIVESLKASRDRGSRFVLFGLSGAPREVLQLQRLLKTFEIYDTEAEALAS
jgi:anti-sigma B factor antagonist